MNDNFEKYIDSVWENKPRPESLAAGQIWTLFADPNEKGSMVVVHNVNNEGVLVYPAHHHSGHRRGIDVTLKTEDIDFSDVVVVMTDASCRIDSLKFSTARFIGNVTESGMTRLLKGIQRYQTASNAVARLQYLHARGSVTEVEEDKAFADGIMEFVPARSTKADFESFTQELKKNVLASPVPSSTRFFIDTSSRQLVDQCKKLLEELRVTIEPIKDNDDAYRELEQVLTPLCRFVFFRAATSTEYKVIYDTLYPLRDHMASDIELRSMFQDSGLLLNQPTNSPDELDQMISDTVGGRELNEFEYRSSSFAKLQAAWSRN